MPQVESIEALVSVHPRKRFGLRYAFGCAVFGESNFGDDGVFGWIYGFGCGLFGDLAFGSDDEMSGIWQTGHWGGRTHIHRMHYYWPKPARNAAQDASRIKFAAAIVVWQALTSEQKAVYNKNALGHQMSGYNLFIKKYLLS